MSVLRRCAFTLVEVMIAMAILAMAIAAIGTAITATLDYQALGNAQDDISFDEQMIMRAVRADLCGTAWFFPLTVPASILDPLPTAGTQEVTAGISSTEDRNRRYYPYVQLQESRTGLSSGLGSQFPHHRRQVNLVYPVASLADMRTLQDLKAGFITDGTRAVGEVGADTSPVVTEESFLNSWLGRSQEIIFLRQTSGAWRPSLESLDSVDLSRTQSPSVIFAPLQRSVWTSPNNHTTLKILHPSGWSLQTSATGIVTGFTARPVDPGNPDSSTSTTTPYGVVMESGLLMDANGDLGTLSVNWETMDGSGFKAQDPANAQPFLDNLREYSYCVVPSQYGTGCLVRARRVSDADTRTRMNPTAGVWAQPGSLISWNPSPSTDGMAIDAILSNHVTRIVFDTYRTVSTLDINQIKVRIYFARRSERNPSLIVRKIYETVVCMRGRNSGPDKDFSLQNSTSVSLNLGSAPVGLIR